MYYVFTAPNLLLFLQSFTFLITSIFALSTPSISTPTNEFGENSLRYTYAFTTASGLPVCRYGLGGAARSSQPKSLPSVYYDYLKSKNDKDGEHRIGMDEIGGAPFYFYYNPHRYPAFMSGIKELLNSASDNNEISRKDVFVASGGTDRSFDQMEKRLTDALEYCCGEYLDLFVLEYVCPHEMNSSDIQKAIEQALSWVDAGKVRYIAASTHSHVVGAALAKHAGIDALMLRYNMAHKYAAESLSFASCLIYNKPVIAFTSTRWNALQRNHESWDEDPPTTGDCLSFALAVSPPVEVLLHSARDEVELEEALNGIQKMPREEVLKWKMYGDLNWNDDGFDEYPEERLIE